MSYDHKPEDELELARIKNAGGKVTMDGRVNGGLNLSRAIGIVDQLWQASLVLFSLNLQLHKFLHLFSGDHFYKRNKALPPEEQMISAMPDVKVLTLNEDHDFMVIACDGIWWVSGAARWLSKRLLSLTSCCSEPSKTKLKPRAQYLGSFQKTQSSRAAKGLNME